MAIIPTLADTKRMKNKTLIVTFLSIAAFAVGCKQSDQTTTSQQMDKVQADTTQAAQDMKDYTYAQKAEFVKSMQAQLDTLNQDIDTLSAKIDGSSDAVKADAKPKLQALRDQAAQLKVQLADVQNATESTWDSVKAGTKSAYASCAKGVVDARQWLSDKIAP
jgi:chromosome segregation ATPase